MRPQHLGEARQVLRIGPGGRLPQPGADHAFRAVPEHMLDIDHEHVLGEFALNRHGLPQIRIAHDQCLAADPQGIGDAQG